MARRQFYVRFILRNRSARESTMEMRVYADSEFDAVREVERRHRGSDVEVLQVHED